MSDSREQLEADMLGFMKGLDIGWVNIRPLETYLDRQAAITRAEREKDRDEWKAKAEAYRAKAYGYCCDKLSLMNICGGADPECCNYMVCPMVLKAVDGE